MPPAVDRLKAPAGQSLVADPGAPARVNPGVLAGGVGATVEPLRPAAPTGPRIDPIRPDLPAGPVAAQQPSRRRAPPAAAIEKAGTSIGEPGRPEMIEKPGPTAPVGATAESLAGDAAAKPRIDPAAVASAAGRTAVDVPAAPGTPAGAPGSIDLGLPRAGERRRAEETSPLALASPPPGPTSRPSGASGHGAGGCGGRPEGSRHRPRPRRGRIGRRVVARRPARPVRRAAHRRAGDDRPGRRCRHRPRGVSSARRLID